MTLPRWLRNLRFWIFYRLITKGHTRLITLGDECQWTISDEQLDSKSHVLCAGAGNDISFERAIITSYGCPVVLLDPSPTGIKTVKKETLPGEKLRFFPIGLASTDGLMVFHEPRDPNEGSFVGSTNSKTLGRKFPCQTLSSVTRELGWSYIDLLKIDIEGFEFDVINDIIAKQLDVRQICVEFHHGGFSPYTRKDTVATLLALRKAGYDLIHRNCWDHTFLRRRNA